jgi:UDP-N-acetylmuramyl pentapeptide phosphotransferase/UDP-N-acetylglucosamine-1-phosphate transferase
MDGAPKQGWHTEAWTAHRSMDGAPKHGGVEIFLCFLFFLFFFCPFLLSLSLSLSPRTFLFLYFTSQRMNE